MHDLVRQKVLAAASSAAAASQDLIEAARCEHLGACSVTDGQTMAQLIDAIRLLQEAIATDQAVEEILLTEEDVLTAVARTMEAG